jgi:hypothetical protein
MPERKILDREGVYTTAITIIAHQTAGNANSLDSGILKAYISRILTGTFHHSTMRSKICNLS